MASKFVEVNVEAGLTPMGGVIHLTEKGAQEPCELNILISLDTALYIASILANQHLPRPMTLDLVTSILAKFCVQVKEVKVTKLVRDEQGGGGTFHAEIFFKKGNKTESLDCRPSDGIALAVRAGAPVYVAEELLELPSIGLPSLEDEEEGS